MITKFQIYHDYGLKHVCLITTLIIYQFIGAVVFYFCEVGYDESKEKSWNKMLVNICEVLRIAENRTRFVFTLIPLMFNNTDYLFFLTQEQTNEVSKKLHNEVELYEKQLGIKYTDQKIKWDFWNAMLYAQTLCTTIGYGHLYPSTVSGRVFTMIYAIFGIPLVLSILDDLGKLLTRCLKTPWWLTKCACRRLFRCCTKQTITEIQKLDAEDKRDLDIFDLPIPIAIFVVILWIFVCSATFCIWERDWDYFVAFYFFFISLSTIGLGDITPTQPKYLLMLFIYIIVGLSLVSMCINLIQIKMKRTYEAGRLQELELEAAALLADSSLPLRRGSSLGVFRTSSSAHSLNKEAVQFALLNRRRINKTCQTMLSFPSPSCSNAHISRTVSNSRKITDLRVRYLPRTLSIDDVMQMVDTEDGDILVLTDLNREESGFSQNSQCTTSSSDESTSHVVVSKSFDANLFQRDRVDFPDAQSPVFTTLGRLRLELSRPSVEDIEAIEELEDRIALGQVSNLTNTVHFRSRLSLIPENVPSTVEECDEPSEDSNVISTDENTDNQSIRARSAYIMPGGGGAMGGAKSSTNVEPKMADETKTAIRAVDFTKTAIGAVDETRTAIRPVDETRTAIRPVDETKTAIRPVDDAKTAIGIPPSVTPSGGSVCGGGYDGGGARSSYFGVGGGGFDGGARSSYFGIGGGGGSSSGGGGGRGGGGYSGGGGGGGGAQSVYFTATGSGGNDGTVEARFEDIVAGYLHVLNFCRIHVAMDSAFHQLKTAGRKSLRFTLIFPSGLNLIDPAAIFFVFSITRSTLSLINEHPRDPERKDADDHKIHLRVD
ncbi:Ion channel [Dictyocaulus viviparus]|uniref:Ion channel n=1 Tax=Dictyocaulus viviparus TaxID=29172 RepID=A0A0D8Y995_DICVI|nr:Ion channel [Dictyocaulus viviparus]